MSIRSVKPGMAAERLDSFRDFDRSPASNVAHKGACRACGVETTRSVTRGPEGSPLNGFECADCSEKVLRAEMADRGHVQAVRDSLKADLEDPRRI